MEFEVKGKRKRGRPKKTWKMQVEKESKSVGFGEGGCHESSEMESGSWKNCCGVNPATPIYGDKPGSKIGFIGVIDVI